MRKARQRSIWWFLTAAYVALIYLSEKVSQVILFNAVNLAGSEEKFLMYIYAFFIVGGMLLSAYMFIVKEGRALVKFILFLGLIGLFLWVISLTRDVQGKVHLMQYGILSLLVYNALKVDLGRFEWRLYLAGFAICVAVALGDETIQLFVPGRHFELLDIVLDATSCLVVFLMIRVYVLKRNFWDEYLYKIDI